ncbi:MFS transporter [Streptantibioticus silvisoli]|uniref:MFS transporter n=1 Tax=Streptantibioticus silvisoli TaxID=2705255 RepID=UPI003559278D
MAVDTTVTGGRGYRELLRTPHAWTFVLPGFAARQPFAMLTISIVLLVRHTTGSYGQAGAAAAVTGVAMAVFAPRFGRLADRFGQRAVLLPVVPAHAAAVAALTVLALERAPLWAVLAAAVPAGASVPQVGPMVRARWALALDGSPALMTAAAFESVTDEFTFVIGPVLATALCAGIHPAAGLIAEGALTLAGGWLFAASRRSAPAPAPRAAHGPGAFRGPSALSIPGVRLLAAAFWGIGAVFGGMQVALTAFTQSIGDPGSNGLLYGIFAAGNMLSGAVCGALGARGGSTPRGRLLVAYTLLVVVCCTLWAAGSPVLLSVLGLLTGACVAPTLVNGYTLVGSLVDAGARTEAFTWLTGAVAFGQAVAVTAAGQLADLWGPAAAFLVPLAGTAPALVVLLALRDRLAAGGPAPVPDAAAATVRACEAVAVD